MRISDWSSDVCSSDLAGDLREHHADILCAQRHFEVEQLLDGEHIGVLHAHRADVIEPVEIGQRLKIGPVLDQLFGAAMEEADVRIDPLDDLSRSEEHTSELKSLKRISYAVFCLKKKKTTDRQNQPAQHQHQN